MLVSDKAAAHKLAELCESATNLAQRIEHLQPTGEGSVDTRVVPRAWQTSCSERCICGNPSITLSWPSAFLTKTSPECPDSAKTSSFHIAKEAKLNHFGRCSAVRRAHHLSMS